MASLARSRFDVLLQRAEILSAHAGRLSKKQDAAAKVIFLHAALATQVAAWDVYVKAVVLEYFTAVSNSTDPGYNALHPLFKANMHAAAKKLNTPNSDKCRDFFMIFSGFDPWPTWLGVKFGTSLFTNSLLTRNRLDEIFTLRHSFAHGFAMPLHSWNTNANGTAHLDCAILKRTHRFFSDICKNTDIGFSQFIAVQHSRQKPW